MANKTETNTYNNQMETFSDTLATARKMQQDWLTYGLDFIHIYVEDADGDWLETWDDENILGNSVLDTIKEFLISNDDVATKIRQHLGMRVSFGETSMSGDIPRTLTLFDLAVDLEECWRIPEVKDRLSAVKDLLAGIVSNHDTNGGIDDLEFLDLADSLLDKLGELI